MNDIPLETVSKFKDLGITLSRSNIFREHIYNAVAKANRMLGMIKKSFCTRDPKCLLILYKAYVRSILEFGCVIWSPYVKYLIDCIEKVQKRFCYIFPYLHGLSYQSKLANLNLLSLESRRLRYKLIFLYKMLNGFCDLVPTNFFLRSGRTTCHLPHDKLLIPYCKHAYRSNFFTVDVISHWNNLSISERNVTSVACLKKSVSLYFVRMIIW